MDVRAWRGLHVGDRLTGGAHGTVFAARRDSGRLVVRRSGRSTAALDWQLDLLTHLAAHGLRVPEVVLTDDGRAHHDGIVVQRFLSGHPPRSTADWRLVVDLLCRVHAATAGWPQRPGFASCRDLLTAECGGDVDLRTMPADDVALVRAAWRPLADGPTCAVHGDVGAGNVLVHDGTAALIDWDESRVDVPALDYAHLPPEVDAHLPPEVDALLTPEAAVPGDRLSLTRAGVAWEAATCWTAEPEYAARRLAELHAMQESSSTRRDRRWRRRRPPSAGASRSRTERAEPSSSGRCETAGDSGRLLGHGGPVTAPAGTVV